MSKPAMNPPRLPETPAMASAWQNGIDTAIALVWAACGVWTIVVFASLHAGFLPKNDEPPIAMTWLLAGIVRLLVGFIGAFC